MWRAVKSAAGGSLERLRRLGEGIGASQPRRCGFSTPKSLTGLEDHGGDRVLVTSHLRPDNAPMSVEGAIRRYRVKPGADLDLGKIDPQEKALFEQGTKEDYEPHFSRLQDELQELQKRLYAENRQRVLVVLQAMDTGGKDGCIKHVFSRIDPQGVQVFAFKKPSGDEAARDFLWRVHAKVPSNGQLVIFNRSHYEDIIAARVKKLFPEAVWKRRYRHILEFERMLADEGTTIVKIFLHISKEEQKRRLEARLANPEKLWKLNPDDFDDRAHWPDFIKAYEDVISRTTTSYAPWYVVPADRKWYRNLCVARILVDTLKSLGMKYPAVDWDPKKVVIGD
jgi:PPK2 family polyphosphate:nucleotide phosphotransferase